MPSIPSNPILPPKPVQPNSPQAVDKLDPAQKKPAEETKPPEKTNWLGRVVIVVAAVAVIAAVAYCLYELICYISEIVRDKFSKESNQELELKARIKGLEAILHKVKQIDGIDKRRVIKRLARCTSYEERILKDLDQRFIFKIEHLKEMLMGAHIRLDDKGNTYDAWSKLASVKARISSHPSDGQQFSLKGALIKELLFSAISDAGKTFTWFQLENHPVSFGSILRHMVDYVKYKISAANQGPYGSSPITDLKPLCISLKA